MPTLGHVLQSPKPSLTCLPPNLDNVELREDDLGRKHCDESILEGSEKSEIEYLKG